MRVPQLQYQRRFPPVHPWLKSAFVVGLPQRARARDTASGSAHRYNAGATLVSIISHEHRS